MRVYIAGPINTSGLFIDNMRTALEAATMVRQAGHFPFIPNLYFMWQVGSRERMPEEEMLAMDREWLHQCDAMIRLPGKSRGADMEEDWCAEAGIPVFKHPDERIGDELVPVRLFLNAVNMGRVSHREVAGPRMRALYGSTQSYPNSEIPDILDNTVYPALSFLQSDIHQWLERQPFGKQDSWEPLVGMMEELGELSHAHLKHHQKIRKMADPVVAKDAKADAIGDILVYAAGYCIQNGLDLGECVRRAWEEVRKRDWNKNAQNGDVVQAKGTDE